MKQWTKKYHNFHWIFEHHFLPKIWRIFLIYGFKKKQNFQNAKIFNFHIWVISLDGMCALKNESNK